MEKERINFDETKIITEVVTTFKNMIVSKYKIIELFFYKTIDKNEIENIHIFIFAENTINNSPEFESIFAQYILTLSDYFNTINNVINQNKRFFVHAVNPKCRIIKMPEKECYSLFTEEWFIPQIKYDDCDWSFNDLY